MMHQRGQPDYSGILIVGVLLVILTIILIVSWRSGFLRFIFYVLLILLQI